MDNGQHAETTDVVQAVFLRRITNASAATIRADSTQYSVAPLSRNADATMAVPKTADQASVEVFMQGLSIGTNSADCPQLNSSRMGAPVAFGKGPCTNEMVRISQAPSGAIDAPAVRT
jgi:hypothetical protein